jgi:hypothetical protein
MNGRSCAGLLGWFVLLGCGGDERPASVVEGSAPAAPVEEASAPVVPSAAEPVAVEPAPIEAPPVDLLHAVGTELAVSSAYRDQGAQVGRLVDGELATAWNSRTGDLVGAWIEVRLPAAAEVTGIALVPGFAHTSGESDLFTGNHRVARVRVLREGVEVGVFALATEARALVTVPATGAGGVWRIEVAEVLPGARTDWRETCISELQILGRAPDARPGERLPRTAIGALPEPLPGPESVDRAALEARQQRDVSWLATAWQQFEREFDGLEQNTGEPDPDGFTRDELDRQRHAILDRVAALVAPVDAARADAVRLARARAVVWGDTAQRRSTIAGDLDVIVPALDAVADFLGGEESRCRTERLAAGLRLERITGALATAEMFSEMDEFEAMEGGGDPGPSGAGLGRDAAAFQELRDGWAANSRGVAARLLRRDAPALPAAASDWTALRGHLEAARTACHWE